MEYKVGSLFSGIGGLCSAFLRTKDSNGNSFKILWANENDKEAIKTYKKNYKHLLIEGDIESIVNINNLEKMRDSLLERYKELGNYLKNSSYTFDEKLIKKAEINLKKKYLKSLEEIKISPGMERLLRQEYEEKQILGNFDEYCKYFTYYVEKEILNIEIEEKNEKWLFNTKKTYLKNRDIILSEKVDVICAGFPWNDFSDGNIEKNHKGELFYSFIELLNLFDKYELGKPRVILLENLKKLLTHNQGNTFNIIKNELEKLGYKIKYKVLNTYKYSKIPQNRERVFILAFLFEKDFESFGSFDDILSIESTREERKEWIKDIIMFNTSSNIDKDYYTKEKYPHYFKERDDDDEGINLDEDIIRPFEFYQIRRGIYVRENTYGVCPSLTANMGTGGHNVPLIRVNDGIRKLKPEECFRLQGFRVGEDFFLPEDVSRDNLYKQAGKAVTINIAELITQKILKVFKESDN